MKQDLLDIVKEFLIKTEKIDVDSDWVESDFKLDLTKLDTRVSPSQLDKILDKLGYEQTDFKTNGWCWDFWGYYSLATNSPETAGLPKEVVMTGSGWNSWLNLRNDKFDF